MNYLSVENISKAFDEKVLFEGVSFGLAKGDVLEDEEGMANMRHLGKSIDWLGRAIAPHLSSYPKS